MCFCRYFVSLSQVRYEHPYQIKERGMCLSLLFTSEWTRTHLYATCRWHVAATSANTGGYNYFLSQCERKCISSPVIRTISSVHNGFDRCGHSIFFSAIFLAGMEFVCTNSLLVTVSDSNAPCTLSTINLRLSEKLLFGCVIATSINL